MAMAGSRCGARRVVRKMAVGPSDGHGLALQGQGGVSVRHVGELQEQAALVDPAGGGRDRGAVYIIGRKGAEAGGVDAQGKDHDLAPDAVGARDPPGGDEFLFHGSTPFG